MLRHTWIKLKRVPTEIKRLIQRRRDREWSRAVLGITDKVLTPQEAAKWLEQDRIQRARNVNAARQRRGPVHW
jgi:hypothetical protein